MKQKLYYIFFFLVIFSLGMLVYAEEKNNPQYLSKEEKNAHIQIHKDKIKNISANIAQEMEKMKIFLPILKKKYKDQKLHYYVNQYPFCNPEQKYWTKRQEAIVTITDKDITEIQFVIEEKQNKHGYGFKRTFITDKTPHDGNFEDILIKHVDYLMPQDSHSIIIKDITVWESKAMIYDEIHQYYRNLSKTMEKDYYYYLQQKRIQQKNILGRGYY